MKMRDNLHFKKLLVLGMALGMLASCSDEPKQNASSQADLTAQTETAAKQPAAKELAIPAGNGYVLKTDPADGQRINQSKVKLYGRVSSKDSTVSLNGMPLSIGEKGEFERTIDLQPGENRYAFVYDNKAAKVHEEKQLEWTFDAQPPAFQVRGLGFDGRLVITRSPVTIAGDFQVPGEKPVAVEEGVTITADGKPLAIAGDRRSFSVDEFRGHNT